MVTRGDDARDLVAGLIGRHLSVATAESLTGGAVCARLVDVPGASATVRGGVVAYATDVKAGLLGVSRDRLAETGPVDRQVAEEMAEGVRRVLSADVGLATTGVAGPGPDAGVPAGTVHVAVAYPGGVAHQALVLDGDRAEVRRQSVRAVIRLALRSLGLGAAH